MSAKEVFKKVRPFIGLIIIVLLILISSVVVFFSVFSALVLPLLWMIFTALHQFNLKSRKITYLWNATRFSMWIYFSTLFLSLIWTPHWMKVLSLNLEDRSLVNVFAQGTYMYGRTSMAFALAAAVFIFFLIHYRWTVRKEKQAELPESSTED